MSFNRDYFKDGEAFEKYVEEVVFPASHFKLLEKTHNFEQNATRYVESSMKPDFKFRSLASGREFYVEVKFRSRYNKQDRLELFKPGQLERYKSYDTVAQPVFLLVGTQGYPDRPRFLSLIPIREIDHLEVYQSIVYRHRIPTGICPENALTPGPTPPVSYTSPNLGNIASGLTINRRAPKRINHIAWILGILIIAVFSAFFLITNSASTEEKTNPLQEKIQAYYKALELNNTEALDYYLQDHLDRWYEKMDVSLTEVKKDADAYNKRYPDRNLEIDWATYKEDVLPNGDYNVAYNVLYRIRPAKSDEYLSFRLAIKSIWDKDLKIKSMYEVRLN